MQETVVCECKIRLTHCSCISKFWCERHKREGCPNEREGCPNSSSLIEIHVDHMGKLCDTLYSSLIIFYIKIFTSRTAATAIVFFKISKNERH